MIILLSERTCIIYQINYSLKSIATCPSWATVLSLANGEMLHLKEFKGSSLGWCFSVQREKTWEQPKPALSKSH